jgi:hypothetical protein
MQSNFSNSLGISLPQPDHVLKSMLYMSVSIERRRLSV